MPQAADGPSAGVSGSFTEASFPAQPDLECDIVMKGGITSGVIYPLAVCELAKTYRLHSLGGASAGAIAAAAAAAAEVGGASLAGSNVHVAREESGSLPAGFLGWRSSRPCSPRNRRTESRCSSTCSGPRPRRVDYSSC
jgi:Patatin-like phospholipase